MGLKRRIVIGKQSGAASVKAKLDELGFKYAENSIPVMLEKVRAASESKKRPRYKQGVRRDYEGVCAMKKRLYLLDSTLRDGEQTPGICFSREQKLRIAALLDQGGVYQIEAGVPATSKYEKENIIKIIENRKNAIMSVWGRMNPSDIGHAIDVRPDIIHIRFRYRIRTFTQSCEERRLGYQSALCMPGLD